MRKTGHSQSARMAHIIQILQESYPDARIGLDYSNAFQLLIATILSAQCTDQRVNSITPHLFAKYPSPEAFLSVSVSELEEDVRPTGFFRNKARNIQGCCEQLVAKHGGVVPNTVEELTELPGVGRKTANCVLSGWFGLPAITVDTHVARVSNRLGFVDTNNPERIEQRLMAVTHRDHWNLINLLFIAHGRTICVARRPRCKACSIAQFCPSAMV